MNKNQQNIKKIRNKIDHVDSEILKLINDRMKYVLEIGSFKQKESSSFYVPSRENEVYQRLLKENKGPVPKSALKAIYREIMSASLLMEKKLKVAYLGPEGTFTHQAALNKFGQSTIYEGVASIKDVFDEIAKGFCDYGVVPIENTTEGAVTHTLDMFVDYDLKICSELTLAISQNLMAKNKDVKIKIIYSHPQVLGQCRKWLKTNYPNVQLIETQSTTVAAEIAKKTEHAASIGSNLAASLYNMVIVQNDIQDIPNNMTRFLIIGHHISKKTGHDKTSLLFSLKDEVGVLYEALMPFKKYNINLTKIESRPSKRKAWEYLFFIDLDGHYHDPKVAKAIDELDKKCTMLKILGSYPKEI